MFRKFTFRLPLRLTSPWLSVIEAEPLCSKPSRLPLTFVIETS